MDMEPQTDFQSNPELWQKVISDPVVRRSVVTQSHLLFFLTYFNAYATHPLGFFHKEMFRLTEDEANRLIVIMAFRNSGKSTVMNLSYALWAILGRQQKKYVIIVSKTRAQARAHFENIKNELEHNDLLRHDLGPFRESGDDWGSHVLDIPDFGAKIMSVSAMQSLRGLRHGIHRPDLIILDDVEDLGSAQHEQNRKRLYDWFMSEVVPAGGDTARIVVLGNLLHNESFLVRLQDDIDAKRIAGVFRAYPLLDDNGRILWPGKFRDEDAIKSLETSVSDRNVWLREYLLQIGPEITYIVTIFSRKDPALSLKKGGIHSAPKIGPPENGYGYVISAPVKGGRYKNYHMEFLSGRVYDPEDPEKTLWMEEPAVLRKPPYLRQKADDPPQ
jgi:hypothetical protein